ncbi:prolipoprotein diacylglyceryl transferase [Agreia sp. COWG]|uniref:prolipoprotein diacylglyceryl transferase n=1 Tax=Agreia sp. COWG TaxID=2773266 RepID=UPI00351C8E3A
MVFAPTSIPSPSPEWQSLKIDVSGFTGWLHSLGLPQYSSTLEIRAYAICILVGIVLATVLTSRRLTARGAEPGVVLDIILWAIPFGIIGARAYHVLTHPGDYFGEGIAFWHVFAVWEGGIAIFGALIGGAVGAWIGCRLSGIRFWTFADALAPGMLLAQAAGRFGNYFNHELFGQPTDLPWGLQIESTNAAFPIGLADGTLFHPTFLYEVIWNLAGVAVLLLIDRKLRPQWGKLFAGYLIWYGVGRTVFETIRVDPSEIFLGVRTNVWGAWLAILVGLLIVIIQRREHPGMEPSPYRPGAEWVPAGAGVDSSETYSDEELRGDEADESPDTDTPEPHATSLSGTTSKN